MMFQLTGATIIQFISLVIYAVLVSLILYSRQVQLKKLFAVFLAAMAINSLVSLIINLSLPYYQAVFWKTLMVPLTTWSMVAYTHFVVAFMQRDTGKIKRAGYLWLAVIFAVISVGYITQELGIFYRSTITTAYAQAVSIVILTNELIAVVLAVFLIRSLKRADDPEERNRISYLLVGLGLMILASVLGKIILKTDYAIAHLGLSANAVLITYALLRYRLLNIQLIMKKWIVYTGVTVSVTIAYFGLLLGLSNMLRLLPPYLGIPSAVVLVVIFSYLFNWAKSALDRGADRLFYGSRYIHRQMLLSFAGKMSNFINMKEIANALVSPLAKAVRANQVGLLLPVNDHYTTSFVARLDENEEILTFGLERGSRMIRWMEATGKPIIRSGLDNYQYADINTVADRLALDESRIAVLCPIISKRTLLAVMAIGEKQTGRHFSRDDIDLIAALSKQSAVAIENAQIYAVARKKADTDELTGLYNHRFFQDFLRQEIDRCSLGSDDFSLIFMDLDLFKTYNDIYGHLMGDELLKGVGRLIRESIRGTDIGARYGGDEFAAILPNTNLESAQRVAERIRLKLENMMQHQGITVTASIGVAAWRTSSTIKGGIVEAADKAVYKAKHSGGNRVCIASETDADEAAHSETFVKMEDNAAVENIVSALAATVDARDHYTYGHSRQVSEYATELAEAIGYPASGIKRIRAAALLHDIGKLNMPDSILGKKDALTDEEWETMKHHPEMGVGILKYIVGLRGCIDAVLFHHERYDGNGYPRGLKGNDIPLDARIMTIADSYDAMISDRSYKKQRLNQEEALRELERCAGTQFDPELVGVFINLRRRVISASATAGGRLPKSP